MLKQPQCLCMFWFAVYCVEMFCFGNTSSGELGLGGIEEEQIFSPRHLHIETAAEVVQVSCGYDHTLFCLSDGSVLSCGSNDRGQLGQSVSTRRPACVSALDSYPIQHVAAGDQFSLALTQWGSVLVWGDNSCGQLGCGDSEVAMNDKPKQIRDFSAMHVVQIACGRAHCLALTNEGELYAWGASDCGQLGEGVPGDPVTRPVLVRSLNALPLTRIVCGGHHSFCITKCGTVFGWGSNSFGQLGIGSRQNQPRPVPVMLLSSQSVRHLVCGESHSVALTQDGAVFTFGAGVYGQLGHGDTSLEVNPRQVFELMGSAVTQLVCGRLHTLVLSEGRKLLAFGLGGSGQLGSYQVQLAKTPVMVRGAWNTDSSSMEGKRIRISAGGNQNFVFYVKHSPESSWLSDDRVWNPSSQILELTVQSATAIRDQALSDTPTMNDGLIEYAERVLGSVGCLNGSFVRERSSAAPSIGPRHCCLDVSSCGLSMYALFQPAAGTVYELIRRHLYSGLVSRLPVRPPDFEALRVYMMLLLLPDFSAICLQYGAALCQLRDRDWDVLSQWFRDFPADRFLRVIAAYREAVLRALKKGTLYTQTSNGSWRVGGELQLYLRSLRRLHGALLNQQFRTTPSDGADIVDESFYIPELAELVSVPTDYLAWQVSTSQEEAECYFCHYPFVFDAAAKTQLLQTDALFQMQSAMQNAASLQFSSLLLNQSTADVSQYLILHVDRRQLVSDTIGQLAQHASADLKKPLRVRFVGEEAEDAGGVKKEFFLILMRELLDPKYGMFVEHSETNSIWFSQDSYEDMVMYYLFGILSGLAIYNSIIVNIPFPLCLYKKLLRQPLGLADLEDLSPTVARSLRQLLAYEGSDLEDVFCLTFEVSREVYGELKTTELRPGGAQESVTQQNKAEYVRLYADHVLNSSIARPYSAFEEGFCKVCGTKVIRLFTAVELMTLVRGEENYDWQQLERGAEYREGYTRQSHTITLFWQVFHQLTEEQKKQFLMYLTGSDRVPILGMKAIKIYIQPSRGGDSFLPVAHTCFNLLDLPEYSTAERLRYKLLQAIQCNEGFGLA